MVHSDLDLSEQFYHGNVDSFSQLYERYKDRIYNYLWNLINYDTDAAASITSDVFIKLFEYGQTKKIENFKALLYTMAHNLSVNWIQKHKSEVASLNDNQREQLEDIHATHELSQIDKDFKENILKDCLMHLNEQQREVLYLHYEEQKSYDEIADIIKSNKNTVGTILSRAKQKLKESMKHY